MADAHLVTRVDGIDYGAEEKRRSTRGRRFSFQAPIPQPVVESWAPSSYQENA